MYETLEISGTSLTGPHHISGSTVSRIVVFLHGYGADGNDLISLSQQLDQGMEDTLFVSPNAPEPCGMAPMGRQWYPIESLEIRKVGLGAEAARHHVDTYIDALLAHYNLPASKLMLVGFSQGCMMALHTAYRRAEPIAGIVGISGALPASESLAVEIKSKPPVTLIHGTADQVVAFDSLSIAAATLASAGVEVLTHAIPGLGHGIDNKALNSTYAMMRRVLE